MQRVLTYASTGATLCGFAALVGAAAFGSIKLLCVSLAIFVGGWVIDEIIDGSIILAERPYDGE